MKDRPLLTLLFVAIGLSMIACPIYYGYNEPIQACIAPEPIPTIAEPVIEPTATPTPSPEPTIEPTVTPSPTLMPTPVPTPTPFPQPDFCFDCTNTWETRINGRTSTGEFVVIVDCYDSVPLQNRAEVQAFMMWENSKGDNWTCGHYARAVHNNAEANGIKCYFTSVKFTEFTHAIVMFPTIDDGDVYVDPQGADKWAYIPDSWNSYSIEFMSHVNTFTPGVIVQPYSIIAISNF